MPATATHLFLDTLWSAKDDDQHILIWKLEGKHSAWFTDVQEAAIYADKIGRDCYVGVGLSPSDMGPHKRCLADQVIAIPGLWADLDYADGDAHKDSAYKLPLPPDEAGAMEILNLIGLEPTIIVHSGHGLQAYWLFKELLECNTPAERTEVATLSRRWQATISAKAKTLGYSVDSVHDLARILRVPGTLNCKSAPVPVRLLKHDGPRYADPSDLELVMVGEETYGGKGAPTSKGRDWQWFEQTLGGVPEGDRNERLTSLSGKLLREVRDIEDQDAVRMQLRFALLVNEKNLPPLDDKDARTVFFSALRMESAARAQAEAEEMFGEQYESLLGAEGTSDHKMEAIKRSLGLPIKAIVKMGRCESEYVLQLDDGRNITCKDVLHQKGVRRAIMDATDGESAVVIPLTRQENWNRLCLLIGQVADRVDMPEIERATKTEEWIESYLSNAKPHDEENWKTAVSKGEPFLRDGEVHIQLIELMRFVRIDVNIDLRSLAFGLRECGFGRKQVQASDGEVTIRRRYYSRPSDFKVNTNTQGAHPAHPVHAQCTPKNDEKTLQNKATHTMHGVNPDSFS